MKEDLINFYRQYHNTIPVAPLAYDCDVPLCEFYVQPTLTSVNVQSRFGTSERQQTTSINSYHDLLFHEGDNMCHRIYVTANAGVGKTSFAKKICMTWCQAHSPIESLTTEFKQEDVDTMRKYDLCFLLSFRDQDSSICDLDSMICNGILAELERSSRYTKTFLEDALHTSTCLVVLDGLDEWSHPANCSRGRRDELPHIPARERCSILITTRSWKLDVINPRRSQIDKQVEINELDHSLTDKLVANAVKVLNTQTGPNWSKTAEEFQTVTATLKLDTIRYIPYILLQMVCLWFDGKSIGNSKLEIYSNIIELTLSRGQMKLQEKGLSELGISNQDAMLPPNILSITHNDVMQGLAKVAFETLFSLKRESSLVFERSVVLEYLQENTLTFCLEMGLLSQNKDYKVVSCKRSNFSFQHKSIQEYFAACYIESCLDDECIRERILQVCKTLPAILDMSNVFIFLGGLNPVTCEKVLQMLHDTIENDETTREFRGSIRSQIWPFSKYHKNVEFIIKKFQNMKTNVVQEIKDKGYTEFPCSIQVEDIFIDEHYGKGRGTLLKTLIDNSRDNIKSLTLEMQESETQFTKVQTTLGLQNVHSLHKLIIEASLREEDLNHVLSGSVHTLTSLILHKNRPYDAECILISQETTNIMVNMDNLRSVSLNKCCLAHFDISKLFEYFRDRTAMVEIALVCIRCKDHGDKCIGHYIDLSQHQKLKLLKLDRIPVSDLHVYSLSLATCLLGKLPHVVHPAVVKCLREASNLHELRIYDALWQSHLQEILPKWVHLKSLFIMYVDLDDEIFLLPPEMKSLEDLRFSHVTITIRTLKGLIQSIDDLPQSVTFKLHKCTVTPLSAYNQIKGKLRSSQKYEIQADEDDYFKYMTLK